MKNRTRFTPSLFSVWAKKKFGVVSITPASKIPGYRAMLNFFAAALNPLRPLSLANAAEGWHRDGFLSGFAVDASAASPYLYRYLMVQFAPNGTSQPSGIPYTLPAWALFQQYATNRLAIPLGICTDDPFNNATIESNPVVSNIQLLGGAQGRTSIGVTDSVVAFNTLLVGSSTTSGMLTALPNTPGSYWSPGLSLSTSEGLGAQIEFDPRVQVVNVDVIT